MNEINSFLNKIFVEDTFELMTRVPENSVNLIIADGPYAVTTHKWDKVSSIQEYNLNLIKNFSRILKPGGSAYLFGKNDCIDFIDYRPYLNLNSRIIWYQPSRLAQGRRNYTSNYDIICFFSKGQTKTFNLDDIRIPQLVELTQRLRCENVPSVKKGRFNKTKFNPKGKNPGDVWGDIKQLTYRSKELISREMLNTIQKPEKLLERLIKASSYKGDIVFDAFAGTGTALKIAKNLGRKVFAAETDYKLAQISSLRASGMLIENDINYAYA
ncbi:MAG: site-specific DNA-methyltransferase [Spirochaetia bacterium]|nr:site-specific DNA-methyltransferase [Spirochaetia bacterium]